MQMYVFALRVHIGERGLLSFSRCIFIQQPRIFVQAFAIAKRFFMYQMTESKCFALHRFDVNDPRAEL